MWLFKTHSTSELTYLEWLISLKLWRGWLASCEISKALVASLLAQIEYVLLIHTEALLLTDGAAVVSALGLWRVEVDEAVATRFFEQAEAALTVHTAQLRLCLNALSLFPGSSLSRFYCIHDLSEGQGLVVAVANELVDDLVWVLIPLDGLSEDLNDDFLVS